MWLLHFDLKNTSCLLTLSTLLLPVDNYFARSSDPFFDQSMEYLLKQLMEGYHWPTCQSNADQEKLEQRPKHLWTKWNINVNVNKDKFVVPLIQLNIDRCLSNTINDIQHQRAVIGKYEVRVQVFLNVFQVDLNILPEIPVNFLIIIMFHQCWLVFFYFL